jgi:hypothetical protein
MTKNTRNETSKLAFDVTTVLSATKQQPTHYLNSLLISLEEFFCEQVDLG